MAYLAVRIHIPGKTADEILNDSDWFDDENNMVIVDEAYLKRHEDDSFFMFSFIAARDEDNFTGERSPHEATQAFIDGHSERCPRCLSPIKPDEWNEHMSSALMGDCKLAG